MLYLETERLILRRFAPGDADDFHAFMSLPEVARYEDFDPFTREESAIAVARYAGDAHIVAVALRPDGPIIGCVNWRPGEYGAAEIGYDFHPAYGGRGYATEACVAFIGHLIGALGVRRVVAECNDDNDRSIRLLERLGLRREGYHLQDVWFKRDATGAPVYVNSYVYAILRHEWLQKHPLPAVTRAVDGVSVRLAAPFDLSFLAAYGRVFRAFDDQDSGNLCFGVEDSDGNRSFVKLAGAPTLRAIVPPEEAVRRLVATVPLYEALAHPALLGITAHGPVPGGYVTVSPWFDGIPMGRMYGQTERILALPPGEKLAIFATILDFHAHADALGYAAVDFYDGCVLYDPDARVTRLCDVEFYRAYPFVNEMGRMWGSGRYMAPEEFARGAIIDSRTNVYRMGAAAFQLLGAEEASWQASPAAYGVALRATADDPDDRYPGVADFRVAWEAALG